MKRLLCVVLLLLVLAVPPAGAAPVTAPDAPLVAISLTGGAYLENFDTLAYTPDAGTGSVLPTGWAFFESGTAANTTYGIGTGSLNTGNTYSFGATGATERAFGGVQSGALIPVMGAQFANNAGDAISALAIQYNCEQWRLGATARTDRLDFYYSLDATSLTTGAWTAMTALNCSSAVTTGTLGALDGNASANRTAISGNITGLNIANGATFWLRWNDFNVSGADDGLAVDDFSLTPTVSVVDIPPTVSSTIPANGATGVNTGATITINFSEIVDATASAFTIECPATPSTPVAFTSAPVLPANDTSSVVLTPSSALPAGTTCTVTAVAAQITDNDGTTADQLDDNMDGTGGDSHAFSFTTASADPCADPFTPIYEIQGSGAGSPVVNTTVDVEGVVVGDFQSSAGHYGFYIQDATGDGNTSTSDGVFVYVPDANPFAGVDVQVGDALHLRGTVKEYNGLTEIDSLTALNLCGTGSVTATAVNLPEVVTGALEEYEGMLITFPETLTVSQNYFQGRYGQVTLSSDGRMYNPTNGNGLGDTVDLNARRILVLDDGYSGQNPNPTPYIGADNTLRAGDTATGLTGTLDYGLISSDGMTRDYRLQPTQAVSFTRANNRTVVPASVGGNIKVASFNVLNYFTTWGCGDACRGANNATEFSRQRAKIIAALQAINADVVGLMEIENNSTTAVGDLVAGLNSATGAGTYAYVVEPAPGTDAIKVAMIYKPGTVTPDGAAQNYQDTTNPTYNPLFDRPPLAQTFFTVSTGERFTVIVNHFKSKGCDGTESGGDLDLGQGCWNAKRTAQATGLLDFVAALQTSTLDDDVLVIGDLNAYGAEDPIATLVANGLLNEVGKIASASRYSYIFDGQSGYLDQGLATPNLDTQISGQTIWHINADEPSVIDYNTEYKAPLPNYPPDLYSATPYRSSDHDPVVVGLDLTIANDLSDLPVSYGAAWHTFSELQLGNTWTAGHAAVGSDSNDGVVRTPGVAWSTDDGGSVDVTVIGTGYVTGWIDWNQDGDFGDNGEQIFTNEDFTTLQNRMILFDIPDGTTFGTTFNARFRVYPDPQILDTLVAGTSGIVAAPSPSGGATGGEVEDYSWAFSPTAVTLGGLAVTNVPGPAWPAAAGFGALGIILLARRRQK